MPVIGGNDDRRAMLEAMARHGKAGKRAIDRAAAETRRIERDAIGGVYGDTALFGDDPAKQAMSERISRYMAPLHQDAATAGDVWSDVTGYQQQAAAAGVADARDELAWLDEQRGFDRQRTNIQRAMEDLRARQQAEREGYTDMPKWRQEALASGLVSEMQGADQAAAYDEIMGSAAGDVAGMAVRTREDAQKVMDYVRDNPGVAAFVQENAPDFGEWRSANPDADIMDYAQEMVGVIGRYQPEPERGHDARLSRAQKFWARHHPEEAERMARERGIDDWETPSLSGPQAALSRLSEDPRAGVVSRAAEAKSQLGQTRRAIDTVRRPVYGEQALTALGVDPLMARGLAQDWFAPEEGISVGEDSDAVANYIQYGSPEGPVDQRLSQIDDYEDAQKVAAFDVAQRLGTSPVTVQDLAGEARMSVDQVAQAVTSDAWTEVEQKARDALAVVQNPEASMGDKEAALKEFDASTETLDPALYRLADRWFGPMFEQYQEG